MLRPIIILGSLALLCLVSVLVKENYPFSHFPMYGSPSERSYYYWLATAEREALPIQVLTKKTSAQLGKILRTYGDQQATESKVKHRDQLSTEDVKKVGDKILAFLRQEAASLKQTMPAKLAIMRTDIRYTDGKVSEVSAPFYTEQP
jgi:hypothetical protein